MRIGPLDPTTHKPQVGVKNEVERSGFSGGFKIPEEYRKSKIKKLGLMNDKDQEEDLEATQQSHITKDEIFQQLNLGHSEAGIGIGRHGTNSKTALAKDLVEGIEKDLEKLRRQQENLQLRKTLALNGGQTIIEETNEEKSRELQQRLKFELEQAGTHVIDASPKKFQVMRHQASQLTSVKNLDIDELGRMRQENEKRMRELEEIYMRKRENSSVGRIMREKMGYNEKVSTPRQKNEADFDRQDEEQDDDVENQITKSQKKKKSVRIVDEKENNFEGMNRVKSKERNEVVSKSVRGRSGLTEGVPHLKGFKEPSRSASGKRKQQSSPIHYDSPRRKLYEAKFEKFLSNKNQKEHQDKRFDNMKKEDFDRYTKGPESPSKSSKRFNDKAFSRSQYDPESLIPKDYDEKMLVLKQLEEEKKQQSAKKDKFKVLGISNEDKMTFFLLKWIFNAIKRDSSDEDPKLKGRSYVTKTDLIKQLGKNDELMRALGYHDSNEISQAVKVAGSSKEGCLVWEEFLDFFFLRQSTLQKRIESNDNWWRKIGNSSAKDPNQQYEEEEQRLQNEKSSLQKDPKYGGTQAGSQGMHSYKLEDPDKKPVKMTENLKMLQETRMNKTSQDVEEEFKTLQDKKLQDHKFSYKSNQPQKKQITKATAYDYEAYDNDDDQQLMDLGFKRDKSQCLLLKSQIFIMQEIFEAMDRYQDKILRRSDFVMALRTDERVVEFIDIDAVQVPYSKRILVLDEVLVEIEKDELFEIAQMGKNSGQINHKEFITWREFIGYFNDYREVDERNKKTKEIQITRKNMQNERQNNTEGSDQGLEIASLMDKEKQRRLQELPKIRPADQIDISEKQLQLLKDIYDQQPRAQVVGKDMINTIDFFIATRKNPQLRAISSAIARDPEGYSRIPRETFQQVFDRMENELQSKQLDWATIVEFFTKRGRPLSKEEINRLIEDDRKQREEEEAKKRYEDEAEKRRMARLMEDLEDKEDFEEFEMRQKSELAAKTLQEKRFEQGKDSDFDEDEDRGRSRGHRFMDESQEYGSDDDIQRDTKDHDYQEDYTSDPELRTAKRDYKFGEAKNKRTQSVKRDKKGFDEYNIRQSKLTTKDYIDHDRSLSRKKKGKYGVTVPKPFGFDMRDKTKQKSIREKKVEEMVAEKQVKEKMIITHQFRHNPIPPEVLIPRYKSITEANEMRRLEVKKNSMYLTKQNEQPFSFYERDKNKQKTDPEDYVPYDLKKPHFKANPIPRACSVLIFDQMMKKQEEEREERIRKQAELNFSKAKLPDRMQMHQEKMKQQSQSQSQQTLASKLGYSFMPKINELVTREQFEKSQQKFNQKLNKKKSQQQVTRPKSPNFTKTSSKTLERQYLNESQPAPVDKFKQALQKKLATSMNEKAAENPSSTMSTNLAMQKRREELEAKRKAEEAVKKEDKERFERQNKMKNTVQSALKERLTNDKQKREEEKEKRNRENREQKKEAARQAREREEKVKGMPLLIERLHSGKNNSNLAKIKATQSFLDILKQNGVDPKQHLSEEQKELLAEQEYIERRKKELGK